MEVREINIYRGARPNFGWHIKSHEHITELALERFPKLIKYKKNLLHGSKMPDVIPSMSGIFSNKHRYRGQNLSKTDGIEGHHHALDMFVMLHERALALFAEGKLKPGMKSAGMAIHFLQDAMCPMHQSQTRRWLFLPDLIRHLCFEREALNSKEILAKRYRASNQGGGIGKGFKDNFVSGYKYVSELSSLGGKSKIFLSYVETIEKTKNYLLGINAYLKTLRSGDKHILAELGAEKYFNK